MAHADTVNEMTYTKYRYLVTAQPDSFEFLAFLLQCDWLYIMAKNLGFS